MINQQTYSIGEMRYPHPSSTNFRYTGVPLPEGLTGCTSSPRGLFMETSLMSDCIMVLTVKVCYN